MHGINNRKYTVTNWRGKDGIYALYKNTATMAAFEKYYGKQRYRALYQSGVDYWDLSWKHMQDLWGYIIGFGNSIGYRISWHGSNIEWTAQILDIEPKTLKIIYQEGTSACSEVTVMRQITKMLFAKNEEKQI